MRRDSVQPLPQTFVMPGSPQSDSSVYPETPGNSRQDRVRPEVSNTLQERELDAALQLLVERAQYITGATGTALALPQDSEMVCRASAGACAPAVGARLQVRSGLTGESITRRQLLRCDNAETDPRVNLETCRALGIASIVVLPLLRRNGEVRGLFELFSDHPYAFEERDLVALERMAALTLTALDLAEQRQDVVVPATPIKPSKPPAFVAPALTSVAKDAPSPHAPPEAAAEKQVVETDAVHSPASVAPKEPPAAISAQGIATAEPRSAESQTTVVVGAPAPKLAVAPPESASQPIPEAPPSEPPPVPEAMLRVQKCASCGFPVSEGRRLCLDCESQEKVKGDPIKKADEKNAPEESTGIALLSSSPEVKHTESGKTGAAATENSDGNASPESQPPESSDALTPDEILPPFLANPQLIEESWLARHVNLLALVVLVLAVMVAAVVFFR